MVNYADCSASIRQRPSLGLRGSSGAGNAGGRARRGANRAGTSRGNFLQRAGQLLRNTAAAVRRRAGGRRATRRR